MSEKTFEPELVLDGQKIMGISEGELTINYEQNTVERDCEVNSTYGTIRFKAVFTREQWEEYVELSKRIAGEGNDKM